MKDFTLSEIKAKCTGNCPKCCEENEELSKFCCKYISQDEHEWPCDWDIEHRCLVELPCKIGDKLYGLQEELAMERLHPYSLNRKGVFEYTVSMITIKKDNTVVIRLTYYNPWRECKVSIDVDELRVYGYNLHKTREEAEAELKALNEGE